MGLGGSKKEESEDVAVVSEDDQNTTRDQLIEEMKKYIDEKLEVLHQQNRELQTSNANYKEEYEKLYQKHEALIQEMSMKNTKSKISEKAIDEFVKTLMNDPKTNIRGLPDAIESALYKKSLKTIMYAFAHTVDVTSLKFMGHKIGITIEPDEPVVQENVVSREIANKEHQLENVDI